MDDGKKLHIWTNFRLSEYSLERVCRKQSRPVPIFYLFVERKHLSPIVSVMFNIMVRLSHVAGANKSVTYSWKSWWF